MGSRSIRSDGTAIESCTYLTLPANALMTDIHNTGAHPHRMLAIGRAEDRDVWLDGASEGARAVLKPYPADLMLAYEVGTRVNSVKNNDPSLTDPVRARSVA
ncbi:MAG: SOS response-associated peptidase family protein [Steroidobacteraceae bacterium]